MRFPIFCIGTSAGGVDAIQKILEALPVNFPNPIIVTQHLSHDTIIDVRLVFGRASKAEIIEATDKVSIQDRSIFFAPPGYHLLMEKDLTLSLSQDEPVHFARPSIDVFFESAAWALEKDCCGILLTGANQDGASGLMEIQRCGGTTIVENPKTAAHGLMPQAALDLFKPDYIVPLSDIAQTMVKISEGGIHDESKNLDRG